MNDYDRIARIIEHLDRHHIKQPDLSELAGLVHLSPFHFHRLFSSWAGVTPKNFVQCLTLNHARDLLKRGDSVLDASLTAGLSGPGRLHDLCVHLEAATPGDIKSGGNGLALHYGYADTPFGMWLSAESQRGLCHVSFESNKTDGKAALQKNWPHAQLIRDDVRSRRLVRRVFHPSPRRSSRPALRAYVAGTTFQVKVWRALLQLPAGRVISYGQLATLTGNPKAARAVGNAVGQNQLAYVIPCHRVIRETGVVGHYRWDTTRKRALLGWEGALTSNGI